MFSFCYISCFSCFLFASIIYVILTSISFLQFDRSLRFFFQPASPIRCEIGVKLRGTRCNLIITRLNPWLRLHASKKKKMVLREASSTREKSRSSDHKDIIWTSTISVPELTIMVYDLNGLPLCHVRHL